MTQIPNGGYEPRQAKVGDKLMSLEKAVSRFVFDGDILTPCGVGGRVPMALCYEIIRQHKRNLTLSTTGALDNLDMLVGAGCVTRLEVGFTGLEMFGLPLMFRRAAEKGRISVEDYTNLCMVLRFMAGAVGLPFVPLRSVSGSDIEKLSTWHKDGKLKRVSSPFTGQSFVAVQPCIPNVAIFHAQQADSLGNTQVWGLLGSDVWASLASKHIVVSAERIVDTATIRRNPNLTVLPDFAVDAVVEAPWGGHPWAVQGFYDIDMEFRSEYARAIKSDETFEKWLGEWVYGVTDHVQYVQKLGHERLERLSARERSSMSMPVDYGY